MFGFFSNKPGRDVSKEEIVVSVLATIVAYALVQTFVFYNNFFVTQGLPTGVFYKLAALVLVLYVVFMFYIYPIMVTFKMNLWHVMDKYIVQLVTPKNKSEAVFNDDEYPDFDDDYDEEVFPEDEYLL